MNGLTLAIRKDKKSDGFTIVELLIVIVVIGILAAITIVAYNGIQTRAENTKTVNAVGQYARAVMMYGQDKGTYPGVNRYRCLVDTNDNANCSQVGTSAATCFGLGGALKVNTGDTFYTDIASTVSSMPRVSSQSMNCGGQPYRGAFLTTSSDGMAASISMFLRGNQQCPEISGLRNTTRIQQGDATYCLMLFGNL